MRPFWWLRAQLEHDSSGAALANSKQNVALRAKVVYIKAPLRDEELYVYKYELPKDVSTPQNLEYDQVEVPITDLRTAEHQSFNIQHNGFQLEKFQVPADINWQNDKDVSTSSAHPAKHAHLLESIQCKPLNTVL